MKVLVAVDGSDNSFFAVTWYFQNLYRSTHHIIFAHVAAPLVPTYISGAGLAVTPEVIRTYHEDIQTRHQQVKDAVHQIIKKEQQGGSGVSHEHLSEEGDAGHRLCNIAKDKEVGLIVMGTRGLGTIRRTILGSVSDYVLHHAHCPVVICRNT